MKASRIITFVVPLAVAFGATPQLARAHEGRWACREDVQRLCPDITPGPGSRHSIHQCLEDNAANLSQACQDQLSREQARREQVLQACQSDIQSLCSDAGSAPHATIKCLFQHHDDLSQACADALPHHRHHWHHDGPCMTPTPAPAT